jgi:hypothetical protein
MSELTRNTSFKHVSYLWDEAEAAKLAGDEVALLIYRSNLLGGYRKGPSHRAGYSGDVGKRFWR